MFSAGVIVASLGYIIKNNVVQSFGAGIGMAGSISYVSYMLTEYNSKSDNTRKKLKK